MRSSILTIKGFSDGEHVYKIPKLQRGYVWDFRHAKQLIKSIQEHKQMNPEMNLFLGVVIVHGDPDNDDELEVIDGQQRLTTLAMLCRILLDHPEIFLAPVEESTQEELKEKCREKGLSVSGNKDELYDRLLDNSDYKLLKNFVYKEGDSRIKHNTVPDNSNFALVIDKHTTFYRRRTIRIEKEAEYQDAKDAEKLESNNKKTVKENPTSTKEEIEAAMESWRTARDTKDVAKNEFELAKAAAEIEWKKKLGQKVSMSTSYNALSDWVRASLEDQDELKDFIHYLLHNVDVVRIVVEEERQRHKVFKSLNAFGKDLSASEKIKNDLLSFGTDIGIESLVREEWEKIEERLEDIPMGSDSQDVITDFLWNYCKAQGITKPKDWEGTSSTLKRENTYPVFDCHGGLYDTRCKEKDIEGNLSVERTKLLKFIEELKKWARGYAIIQKPPRLLEKSVSIKWVNEIADIRSLMSKQTRPFLLAAYMNTIGKSGGSKDDFHKLTRCISVALVRLVCSGKISPNKLEVPLQSMTTTIAKESSSEAIIKTQEQVKELIHKYYSLTGDIGSSQWNSQADTAFERQLIQHNEFERGHAKFILRGVEGIRHWRKGSRELVLEFHNTKFYTAEHILPDNGLRAFSSGKGRWWDEHESDSTFNDPSGGASTPPEVYSHHRRKLGNFLILESKLNKQSGTKTWGGISGFPRGTRRADCPTNPETKNWGKFHIFAHAPWVYQEPGSAELHYQGSHLLSVKKFCDDYSGEDHWTPALISSRTASLADQAKRKEMWKFW